MFSNSPLNIGTRKRLSVYFYGNQNSRSKAHITAFFNLSFSLHNFIIQPANKYMLNTIIIGAINLVFPKIVIAIINSSTDTKIRLTYKDIFFFIISTNP